MNGLSQVSETVIDQSSGNIKAKDAVLSLRGVPLCIHLMLISQLTSQRRSGWLLPTVGSTTLVGLKLLYHTTLIYHLPMTQRLQVAIWKNGVYNLMVNLDI